MALRKERGKGKGAGEGGKNIIETKSALCFMLGMNLSNL